YWAVFHGLVVISTGLQGIADVARHAHALTSDPAYKSTDGDQPRAVTSLLFLDFSQLLRLVEQTGLASSMRLGALQADLAKVRAVGLHSTSGESDTTAELFLQIP